MEYNFKISEIKLEGRILKRKLKTVMVNNKANWAHVNLYKNINALFLKCGANTI
jgi:hypothetical protein